MPSEQYQTVSQSDVNEWECAHDEASGRSYYYNTVTRETQWEPPRFFTSQKTTTTTPSSASNHSNNRLADAAAPKSATPARTMPSTDRPEWLREEDNKGKVIVKNPPERRAAAPPSDATATFQPRQPPRRGSSQQPQPQRRPSQQQQPQQPMPRAMATPLTTMQSSSFRSSHASGSSRVLRDADEVLQHANNTATTAPEQALPSSSSSSWRAKRWVVEDYGGDTTMPPSESYRDEPPSSFFGTATATTTTTSKLDQAETSKKGANATSRLRQRYWIIIALLLLLALAVALPVFLLTPLNTNKDDDGNNKDDALSGDNDYGTDFNISKTPIQDLMDCSDLEGDLTLLELPSDNDNDSNNNATQLHVKFSPELCMLVQTDGASVWIPVARSYGGHMWEPYTTHNQASVPGISCDADQGYCTIPLTRHQSSGQRHLDQADASLESTLYYALAWRTRQTLPQDEYARFLEQATFGTTQDELGRLMQTDASAQLSTMATWVHNQMYTIPPEYHRVFLRHRSVSRFGSSHAGGPVTHPCQKHTAYRRYALTEKHYKRDLELVTVPNRGILVRVDNVVLTVVPQGQQVLVDDPSFDRSNVVVDDGSYEICERPESFVGGKVKLQVRRDECRYVSFGSQYGNPPVDFQGAAIGGMVQVQLSSSDVQPLDLLDYYAEMDPPVQRLLTTRQLSDDECDNLDFTTGGPIPIVFGVYQGEHYIHDPRFVFAENTLENPLPDGGGAVVEATVNLFEEDYEARCSNVPRSFLNEDYCILSSENAQACSQSLLSHPMKVKLDKETLTLFYNLTLLEGKPRFVYAVKDLRVKDDTEAPSPCQPLGRSRWIPVDGNSNTCDESGLGEQTLDILSHLLANFGEGNSKVRDIFLPSAFSCDANDTSKKGFYVYADGTCWENVHPDHLQVYDMTSWLEAHPGGADKISQFAVDGEVTLRYPDHHVMSRWQSYKERFPNFGRFGEEIDFGDLSGALQTSRPVLVHYFGEDNNVATLNPNNRVVVCGSPGEVSNDLTLGGVTDRGSFDSFTLFDQSSSNYRNSREVVFTSLVVNAKDQLRQRVAWAFAQLLVINNDEESVESYTHFHDIFMRHAFGSYRDMLKEVAFNNLMGVMLTFVNSRSTAYGWERNLVVEHPDENFAREIMQLFSIGLYELNDDGTHKLGENGEAIRTYSNSDIMEYARAWTGFRRRELRGNLNAYRNNIDPMYIHLQWRDVFPKMGLRNRYVGHGYPLCTDLPEQHYLKKGAKYVLLGTNPNPDMLDINPDWANDPAAVRFTADPNGGLNSILCEAKGGSTCSYPPVVELRSNIACVGSECDVNTVTIVQVEGGIFYEYQQPPCVHHAFAFKPRKLKLRRYYVCADERSEVGRIACCYSESGSRSRAYTSESYWGEFVKASKAEAVCDSNHIDVFDSDHSLSMCSQPKDLKLQNCEGEQCAYSNLDYYWWAKEAPCQIKAKILDADGMVAIVHDASDEDPANVKSTVAEDTPNFFRVAWSDPGALGSLIENCSVNPECRVTSDGSSLFNVEVTELPAFDTAPTKEQVLSLSVGSFDPELVFGSLSTTSEGDVKVYADVAKDGWYSTNTVFEVVDENDIVQRRRNVISTVTIAGTSLSFPNPVHFYALPGEVLRDAYYETDATLDHYFYHENTAPFISIHLAKRFGLSNPSPRLVKEMAHAFRTGRFTFSDGSGNIEFGDGSYGNLGATMAALLLDRESRNAMLDADPTQGHLREPLIKVVSILRNLNFQPVPELPNALFRLNLQEAIGQMAYKSPGVFSFFLPEYQPTGVVSSAGMVSPEAQVLTPSTIIYLMNGLTTAMKYGLDRCFYGFFEIPNYTSWRECRERIVGDFSHSGGYPDFSLSDRSSSDAIVDELATIMTSGRLSVADRQLIVDAVSEDDDIDADQVAIEAQQLISGSSAFHGTGTVSKTGNARPKRQDLPPSDREYKAVVVLFLTGGADTWNMLVPHTCSGKNDVGLSVLEQYSAERGEIGLKSNERTLRIDADGPETQPCSRFAVHPSLPVLQELYEQRDLSFFLNAGVINNPSTKDNYEAKTRTQLFAHNDMQLEGQVVDPYDKVVRSGIMGRASHVLSSQEYGYQSNTIGIGRLYPAVSIGATEAPPPVVIDSKGPIPFLGKPRDEAFDAKETLLQLNDENHVTSSIFGETWSSSFANALEENDFYTDALADVNLTQECGLRGMNMALKMMDVRKQRSSDRDLIFLNLGGWDTHSDMKNQVREKFEFLNQYLECWVANLKNMGLWDKVTLLTVSEFARTITPNSNSGSDHAWGGHYFTLGGKVKGGNMFGKYPNDITSDGPLNVGRGRIIPELSWESIWSSMIEWLGVKPKDFASVLPNAEQAGAPLLRKDDVFES